jgi:hypothetical protein
MAKLGITKKVRTSGDIEIFIDGQKLGVVSDNQTKEFDFPSGRHILHAKLKWLGSIETTIDLDEEKVSSWTITDNFRIFNFSFIYLSVIVLVLGICKENFKLFSGIDYITSYIIIIIPLIIFNIYYLTLGKNKRMLITKNN